MADGTTSAFIAASATLITAFVTQFLAEGYKRFKEGSSVAAGIAGELSSSEEAVPLIRVSLRTASENIRLGGKDRLKFRSFDKPVDRFFDEVVGKVGLLGPELAERVIYIYSNLSAFRAALVLIHSTHSEMESEELLGRIVLCQDALERAYKAASDTLPELKARSAMRFLSLSRG